MDPDDVVSAENGSVSEKVVKFPSGAPGKDIKGEQKQPPVVDDPIVADIKKRTGAKYVTDAVLEPLGRVQAILKNLDKTNPAVFKNNVIAALAAINTSMNAVQEGFRIIEAEDANILVRLHKAYISFVAATDQMIRNDITKQVGRQIGEHTIVLQRHERMLAQRMAEMLRLEHSLMTLFNALCEMGLFIQENEPETPDEAFIAARNKRHQESKEVYQRVSRRVLQERLGLAHKRGPFGETQLLGGSYTQFWNLCDEDVTGYVEIGARSVGQEQAGNSNASN